MVTRKLTCLNDNAQFTEQDAARLCIRCQEPFHPQAGKISRCSGCGAEGNSGKLSCECADGRLEDSGYRCPGCGLEGGAEMLDGPLACPYCLNGVEKPEIPSPKPAAHRFRYIGRVAAIALCVVGTLAAAYALVPQAIQHWDDISKILLPKRTVAKNVQPAEEKPSTIQASQPVEPPQTKPDPRVPEIQDQPLPTAQLQPLDPETPANPPAQNTEATTPTAEASNQPPSVQAPAPKSTPMQKPVAKLTPAAAPPRMSSPAEKPVAKLTPPVLPHAVSSPLAEKPAVKVALPVSPPSVVAPPVIVSFTSSAPTIDRGSTVTLRWQVTGDSPTVTILPGVGAVPSTGSWQVKPEATQRFTLSATNTGEPTPLTRSVDIVVNQPKRPTIVSFTSDSSKVRYGQTTALRWTVLDASEVRIEPGIGSVSASGSAVVRPLDGTGYTLTAIGPGGTSTGTLPVSVDVPPPLPSRYLTNSPPANVTASNRMPFSGNRKDPQALELLAAVQSAMGGKRNLASIHDWQRNDRVYWEANGGWSMETTTFAAPSGIRVESQGTSTAVVFSNGESGWAWSSSQPVRSNLPSLTATSMPLRSLPALLLSDNDPQRTVALAGPSILLIADNHGDRVYLKVDPSTNLPQAVSWTNPDGAELVETYSNWRQGAGIMWWTHMTRSRNHQEFLRADVINIHANQGWTPQQIAYAGP